jgi:nitroimidazol reductase NimA-like FMN-containing flavoprotein (pyridoxamine 5'-phosphate oxidase superfamily)
MIEELDDREIERVLRTYTVGRVGCQRDGRIYVVPVLYAYDDRAIYARSAEGLKLQWLRQAPAVCFEVDDVHGPRNWRSVIAWGTFEELEGDEAARGRRVLAQRLAPYRRGDVAGAPAPEDTAERVAEALDSRPVVFRINVDEWSGRFECSY